MWPASRPLSTPPIGWLKHSSGMQAGYEKTVALQELARDQQRERLIQEAEEIFAKVPWNCARGGPSRDVMQVAAAEEETKQEARGARRGTLPE